MLDLEDIKHWIIFLSRRRIKEIIINCQNNDQPICHPNFTLVWNLNIWYYVSFLFLAFLVFIPNLLSLQLDNVESEDDTFGVFIARCPLLEILSYFDDDNTCELGLIEISKLGNRNKLFWLVCMDTTGSTGIIKSSCFYQLTALLKLQKLDLDFRCGEFMAEAGVDKVPVSFRCLKALTLSSVDFSCDIMISFALKMICNSPNLQTLNIRGAFRYEVSPSAVCSLDLGCYTMKQLQLRSVLFSSYGGSENEVCLIKFILASSPLLKKMVISASRHFFMGHAKSSRFDIAWTMAGKLLNLHRGSSIVDIELH